MTQEERNARIAQAIESCTAVNTRTPELARAALIREGIYFEDGRLRPEYGGDLEDDATPA